jgi:hypothetical protein
MIGVWNWYLGLYRLTVWSPTGFQYDICESFRSFLVGITCMLKFFLSDFTSRGDGCLTQNDKSKN